MIKIFSQTNKSVHFGFHAFFNLEFIVKPNLLEISVTYPNGTFDPFKPINFKDFNGHVANYFVENSTQVLDHKTLNWHDWCFLMLAVYRIYYND